MNKKDLTEADIRTKFITPALVGAEGSKWNLMTQIREEAYGMTLVDEIERLQELRVASESVTGGKRLMSEVNALKTQLITS